MNTTRYFKSLFSDLVWKFEDGQAFTRVVGDGSAWMPSVMTIQGMAVCAEEITVSDLMD